MGAVAEIPIAAGDSVTVPVPSVNRYPFNQTVISQYANSPVLLQIITDMSCYIDPSARFDQFFDLIWNIDTAQGFGLDLWGRILGVGRVLHVPVPGDYLGWKEATDADTFGQGIFFGSASGGTSNFSLSDSAYRRLLLAKALANICDGSVPAINQILINLFPGYGNCYVIDNLDMTMTYRFSLTLSPVDATIVQQSGVLPKPAGVGATVVQGP